MAGKAACAAQFRYPQKLKPAILIMCDKPGIVATSIHSYKSFLVGNDIFIGPCHDFSYQIFTPKNRIGGNSVNIYCGIIFAMLPNFGIGKGNAPHTGDLPLYFNLPNALLPDFGFHHRSFKSRPLVGWKYDFLIGRGQSIEPKYFIEVSWDAVIDFQKVRFDLWIFLRILRQRCRGHCAMFKSIGIDPIKKGKPFYCSMCSKNQMPRPSRTWLLNVDRSKTTATGIFCKQIRHFYNGFLPEIIL